jgi:hypothetical protein
MQQRLLYFVLLFNLDRCRSACFAPDVQSFRVRSSFWSFLPTFHIEGLNSSTRGEVTRTPSFGTDFKLRTDEAGYMAHSQMGSCWPWQLCDFNIYDCENKLLVKISFVNVQQDTRQIQIAEVRHEDGALLGRTTQISKGFSLLGGYRGRRAIEILDTSDRQVAILMKESSQTWNVRLNWDVTHFPLLPVPIADPRILAFLVAYQYSIGLLGPFWAMFIPALLIVCAIVSYFVWRRKSFVQYEEMLLELEEQFQESDPKSVPSVSRGFCCGGRSGSKVGG